MILRHHGALSPQQDIKKIVKKLGFLLLVIHRITCYSQTKNDFYLENNKQILCNEDYVVLQKAYTFFINSKIDSAYIYANQLLNKQKIPSHIKDYANYIFADCAIEKKMLTLAKARLDDISDSFPYKYLVDFDLGVIAQERSEFEKAIIYFKSSLNSTQIHETNKKKMIFHNLGICHLHLEEYKESEYFLLKELNTSKKDSDTLSIIYAKLDLGNLFYVQYRDNIAITYFKEAYELAKKFNNLKAKQVTAQNMAVVEKNRAQYKESVLYYEEYTRWKDSIWNIDKISVLLEKDKEIALAAKQKEITRQEDIAKKQKERMQLFMIMAIIIFLFLTILFYMYKVKVKQNQLIKHQKQQLENLNTTKNNLLSVISHDLRTPLNIININHKKIANSLKSQNLDEAIVLNNKSAEYSTGATQILNNVLNWALQQNDQLLWVPEIHPIEILVSSIVWDYRDIATTKNIMIYEAYADLSMSIYVDKELFKIAVRNLIDNAIKYTPVNGSITIGTSKINQNCILTIKDTGIGISSEIMNIINNHDQLTIEKIDRSKGLGLGLLLSKTLTKKNNGTFTVTNNNDSGVTITLGFPIKHTEE